MKKAILSSFLRCGLAALLLAVLALALPLAAGASPEPAPTPTISTGTIGENHPAEPGDVMLFKQADEVSGMVNTWDITLRIEAKDKPTTSDIVLVIDRSGSMGGSSGRMAAAKNAAKAFVDALLPSEHTRIAVVSFEGDVTTNQTLINDAAVLNSAINGITANGGTFTQAGVRQAAAILDNSNADNKHIVLLSDGVPTFSYKMSDPNNYLSSQYIAGNASSEGSLFSHEVDGNRWATTANAPQSQYTTTRIGAGNSMFHRYENPLGTSNDNYYNHGNSAIAEAGFAWSNGYNVYTVGLQTDSEGSDVLKNMKKGIGTFTEVTNTNQLTPVFETIAGAIHAAAKDAAVTDPMGNGFEITAANVSHIETVPALPAASYDPATKKITWNPGTLTTPIEDGSDIKYAELKYRIEINDDILEETPDGSGRYATNGNAVLEFIDTNGDEQTTSFRCPLSTLCCIQCARLLKTMPATTSPAKWRRKAGSLMSGCNPKMIPHTMNLTYLIPPPTRAPGC